MHSFLPYCIIVLLYTTLFHCSIFHHTVSLFHFQPHCIIIPFLKTLFHFSIVYHTAQYCVWLEPNNTSENDRPKKCTSDKQREKAKCNYAQTRAKAHILQHAHAGTCIATHTRTRNTQEEINIFTHVRSWKALFTVCMSTFCLWGTFVNFIHCEAINFCT